MLLTFITVKKTHQQLIQLGQGERLKEFRESRGYRSRNKFAKFVKVGTSTINAIEWNQNEISETICKEIKKAFPELNILWLLEGKEPKLLTENIKLRIIENLEEPAKIYEQKCLLCIEKDEEIKVLDSKYKALLEKYNECLKEILTLKKATSG
jgi:DNA-binding XRE family transcriptional regulator